MVKDAVAKALSVQPDLRKIEGKKVYDLQPKIDWDKGKALMWLLQALDLSADHTLLFYLGDDFTDEDAFSALNGIGMGIVVDDTFRFTRATYRLNNPDQVQQFLDNLFHAIQGVSS